MEFRQICINQKCKKSYLQSVRDIDELVDRECWECRYKCICDECPWVHANHSGNPCTDPSTSGWCKKKIRCLGHNKELK